MSAWCLLAWEVLIEDTSGLLVLICLGKMGRGQKNLPVRVAAGWLMVRISCRNV